jgi:hypothetical protein
MHSNGRIGSISEFITSWITGSGVRQLTEPEDHTKSSLPSSQFGHEQTFRQFSEFKMQAQAQCSQAGGMNQITAGDVPAHTQFTIGFFQAVYPL